MDGSNEVIVISDTKSAAVNTIIYNLKTGNLVHSFKEGKSTPKGLSFIVKDYLISALIDKPALRVWTLTKTNPENSLMVCPGNVSCLAVTEDGEYCAAGIENTIHLWEVSSGHLLNVISHHNQPVSCLKFSTDGSHMFSVGKDGLVMVWLISALIDLTNSRTTLKPYYVWMDHSSEITDIFVGKLGIYARVATVSRDMTCKIYELDSGKRVTTVCTDFEITAVVMDNLVNFLILGSATGNIYKVNIYSGGDVYNASSESSCAFKGHTKSITSLSLSKFGDFLLSGSDDGCCRLWDFKTLNCIRKVPCNGTVTNAFIAPMPPGLKEGGNYQPRVTMKPFHRTQDIGSAYVHRMIPEKTLVLTHVESPDQYFEASFLEQVTDKSSQRPEKRVSVEEMGTINEQLYAYALADLGIKRSRDLAETD